MYLWISLDTKCWVWVFGCQIWILRELEGYLQSLMVGPPGKAGHMACSGGSTFHAKFLRMRPKGSKVSLGIGCPKEYPWDETPPKTLRGLLGLRPSLILLWALDGFCQIIPQQWLSTLTFGYKAKGRVQCLWVLSFTKIGMHKI